jgi:hypothetical protein
MRFPRRGAREPPQDSPDPVLDERAQLLDVKQRLQRVISPNRCHDEVADHHAASSTASARPPPDAASAREVGRDPKPSDAPVQPN